MASDKSIQTQNSQSSQTGWSFLSLLPRENHRLFFLLVFSTAIYLPILSNGLVWDAELILVNDPRLRELRHAFDFFYQGLWEFVPNRAVDYYRPLVGLLHTVEYSLFGANPLGYNVINLLLNAGVCLLVYQLLRRFLTVDKAFLCSVVYASLPVRAEVVYWTYSDSHLIVAVFILASFICFIDGRKPWALTFYILALLSQEIAVVLPIALLAWVITSRSTKKNLPCLAAYCLAAFSYVIVRSMVLGPKFLASALEAKNPELSLFFLAKNLKILFVQDAPITIYAGDPSRLADFNILVLSGACLLAGLLALAFYYAKDRNSNLVWITWFAIFMLPAILLGKTGVYYMAEKGLFLSCLGVIALIVGTLNPAHRGVVLAMALVITVNAYLTFDEGKYWKNTVTYLEKALEFDNSFILGTAALGDAYLARGDLDAALTYYRKALALNPWHLGAAEGIKQIYRIRQDQGKTPPGR